MMSTPDLKIFANKNLSFIDNSNLKEDHLGLKKLHLNRIGNSTFSKNFLSYLENNWFFESVRDNTVSEDESNVYNNYTPHPSINSSKFSLSFKLANITPVFKNKSRNHKNNYKPVRILPLISKVFEKIMNKQRFPYTLKKFFQNSSVVFAKVSVPNIVSFWCLKNGNGLLIITKFLERF